MPDKERGPLRMPDMSKWMPSLIPRTEAMMNVFRGLAMFGRSRNILEEMRQRAQMRQSYRVRSQRRVRATTNLSVGEKRTRRRIRNLNRGRGPV